MNGIRLSWPVAVLGAAALVLAGVGGAYMLLPRAKAPAAMVPSTTAPVASTAPAPGGPLADVVINLSGDAAKRAGIAVSRVVASSASNTLRLAGVVESDAYRQVVVTPLVAGRVTRVLVELGSQVKRGAPLVELYSPELADIQTRYLSMRAEFQAVEQEIARTQRFVEIGAASKQELERIHAEHVKHRTEVDSARARLQLLGMTGPQIEEMSSSGRVAATTMVVSPIAGAVTVRSVNPGTTVDVATPLVTVVDLSTVWVVGDLYERDFATVRIGMPATVTTEAFPDMKIAGKVSYIDPQVKAETRTARIRVAVANPGQRLRLGMYAGVDVDAPGTRSQLLIPRSAVQNVGDRTVVYLKDPASEARFIEREVRLTPAEGDRSVVLSGLTDTNDVVTTGSFFLRAERERLGLRTN